MEKKKHGLADNQDGEFILNESGTSVSTDNVEGLGIPIKPNVIGDIKEDKEPRSSAGDEEKDITD